MRATADFIGRWLKVTADAVSGPLAASGLILSTFICLS